MIFIIIFLAKAKLSGADKCFQEQTNFRKLRNHKNHGGKLMWIWIAYQYWKKYKYTRNTNKFARMYSEEERCLEFMQIQAKSQLNKLLYSYNKDNDIHKYIFINN